MFDRLFMPALTFTLLIAGFAAIAGEIARGSETTLQLVQLERVVVSASRESPATPLAQADTATAAIVR